MKTLDWKNATPEQIDFWNQVRGLIAWTTITPLYYMGPIAGSEYLVYNAGKMYIALELEFDRSALSVVYTNITLYNMANAIMFVSQFDSVYWDATAANPNFPANYFVMRNCYFSRILNVGYANMKFNGYRLNV